MAKIIEYNRDTKVFTITEGTRKFSDFTKENKEEFEELKSDLSELSPEEYEGRYSRLLFRNQPKTYYVFYPPKSGGGSPHIELSVHPDSTFDFSEVFDPLKYNGLMKVWLIDKRRFKKLGISHRDYDLLATFFCMEFQNKPILKIGNVEVYLEDHKTTFDKIMDTLNNFSDKFYLNDIKRIFPFDDLIVNYVSKLSKDVKFTAKFLKTSIRLSLITDKKPIVVMELNTNGLINLLIDEVELQKVIGNEKDYVDTFKKVFNCSRNGFNTLNIEFINGNMKNSPLRSTYKEYSKDGETMNIFNIR